MDKEKIKYWKKRMNDKIESLIQQALFDFKEIGKNAMHINLETKEMQNKMKDCLDNLERLKKVIEKEKVKK